MRNLFFGLLAMLLFSNLSFGQDLNKILKDPVFNALIKLENNDQKRPRDIKKLKLYISDKKIDEKEFEDLYLALGYKSQDEFKKSLISKLEMINTLESNYNLTDLDGNQLVDLLDQGYNQLDLPVGNTTLNEGVNCDRTYRNCMLIAMATAIGGHIACTSADVTVVLGALCHAAVMTLQYAMQDNCSQEYLDCHD